MAKDAKELFALLLSKESLHDLCEEEAATHVAQLVDLSCDLREKRGLEQALIKIEQLQERRSLPSRLKALLHYFAANAWGGLHLGELVEDSEATWDWHPHELIQELVELRRTVRNAGFQELEDFRRAQVLTNLGNTLDTLGRVVEACHYWKLAAQTLPMFGMPVGNMGLGLRHYAKHLPDPVHRAALFTYAESLLKRALASTIETKEASSSFTSALESLSDFLKEEGRVELEGCPKLPRGRSKVERHYRVWVSAQGLFLNPLSDITDHDAGNSDVLHLPPLVKETNERPLELWMFNQLKQQYVSARWLIYSGVHRDKAHFSDRGNRLFNPLDYPSYCLAVEEIGAGYRLSYSIFDKIAYLLNQYLAMAIPERQVSLQSIWFTRGKNRTLRHRFRSHQNWPLRGLHWLSRDFTAKEPSNQELLDPDAKSMAEVRHHLEHKYLKVHDEFAGSGSWEGSEHDTVAFHIRRSEFEAYAIRLLHRARAALVYLVMAVTVEEHAKHSELERKGLILPMFVDDWDDRWKF